VNQPVKKRNTGIRGDRFCVYNASKREVNVNKPLPINLEKPHHKKYYKKGTIILKFGTAFG